MDASHDGRSPPAFTAPAPLSARRHRVSPLRNTARTKRASAAPRASALRSRRVVVHEDSQQIERIAHTLASAFEDDPFLNYFHSPRAKHKYEKSLIFNRTVLRAELSRPKGESTVHVSDDYASVAIWHHVGHWKISGWYSLWFVIALLRCFGWRGLRMMFSFDDVENLHPARPHMHLFIMGTHKEHQGKGYGSAVISQMLKQCDLLRLPAYLESSNERNIPFYKRHGFEVVETFQGYPDCPPITTMWREPRPNETN